MEVEAEAEVEVEAEVDQETTEMEPLSSTPLVLSLARATTTPDAPLNTEPTSAALKLAETNSAILTSSSTNNSATTSPYWTRTEISLSSSALRSNSQHYLASDRESTSPT